MIPVAGAGGGASRSRRRSIFNFEMLTKTGKKKALIDLLQARRIMNQIK
jgi:hypothetical protein